MIALYRLNWRERCTSWAQRAPTALDDAHNDDDDKLPADMEEVVNHPVPATRRGGAMWKESPSVYTLTPTDHRAMQTRCLKKRPNPGFAPRIAQI